MIDSVLTDINVGKEKEKPTLLCLEVVLDGDEFIQINCNFLFFFCILDIPYFFEVPRYDMIYLSSSHFFNPFDELSSWISRLHY
jgi:hypothetical protein